MEQERRWAERFRELLLKETVEAAKEGLNPFYYPKAWLDQLFMMPQIAKLESREAVIGLAKFLRAYADGLEEMVSNPQKMEEFDKARERPRQIGGPMGGEDALH